MIADGAIQEAFICADDGKVNALDYDRAVGGAVSLVTLFAFLKQHQ